MNHVLVIEDDPITADEIMDVLANHHFSCFWASTGREGLSQAQSNEYDVITLDRMLPDVDGLEVVGSLRKSDVNIPILMISALGDVDERVRGLRAGGDDYLAKPFAPDEMIARIEALTRRRHTPKTVTKLVFADLELDLLARTVYRAGYEISLSQTEFRLLEYMMLNSSQVVTRTMLFEAVWGYSFDPGTNVIDVHVTHLRKKVELPGLPVLFRTVRGVGYVFG